MKQIWYLQTHSHMGHLRYRNESKQRISDTNIAIFIWTLLIGLMRYIKLSITTVMHPQGLFMNMNLKKKQLRVNYMKMPKINCWVHNFVKIKDFHQKLAQILKEAKI
uniref:Uncharacterized protein n=1 Tax=Glossina pallidipes TaxID=7398 RepID=A0A1A9ZP81_GLOPL